MYAAHALLRLFAFFVFFIHSCVPYKLANYQTDLGIKLDAITEKTPRETKWIVYSSVVQYDKNINELFTHAQIAGLAKQG